MSAKPDPSGEGARPKRRGGRIVPSRYMNYEKKETSKAKESKREGSPKRLSAATGGLQSTMLDSKAGCRPDLDFSVIKGKKGVKTPASNPPPKVSSQKKQNIVPSDPDQLIDLIESQTLLLTFASVKMEKNMALLEKKAESELLAVCEEARRLEAEVSGKKLKLAGLKKQREISESLEKQIESLGPAAELCAEFTERYKEFAAALDSTRHELPAVNLYLGEDKRQYLADLQKVLSDTMNVLQKIISENSKENTKAASAAKELLESALDMDAELKRTFEQLLSLAGDVSRETSLYFQQASEESKDQEHFEKLYFG